MPLTSQRRKNPAKYILSPYRAVNTRRVGYTNQSVAQRD